jgi:hypothetical protein
VTRAPLGLIRRITDEIRIKYITEDDKIGDNEDGNIFIPGGVRYPLSRGLNEPMGSKGDETETVPTLRRPRIEEIV